MPLSKLLKIIEGYWKSYLKVTLKTIVLGGWINFCADVLDVNMVLWITYSNQKVRLPLFISFDLEMQIKVPCFFLTDDCIWYNFLQECIKLFTGKLSLKVWEVTS